MNQVETTKVMAVLSAAYPLFYRNVTPADRDAAINLWQRCFANDDYAQVSAAVLALIKTRTSTYPPSVGEVTEKMQALFSPNNMTDLEAWGLVQKALRNSSYNSKEEFEKLPPTVQRAVGDPRQLQEWAQMEESVVQSVIASNFQRSYKIASKRDRDFQALPDGIKQFVDSITKPMFTIGDGDLPELPLLED